MAEDYFVVVTGGTKGIGLAIAQKFASMGYRAVVCSRHKPAGLGSENIEWFKANLAIEADREAFIAHIKTRKGQMKCWVNNAAVFIEDNITSTETELLRKVLETNLVAPLHFCNKLIERILEDHTHVFNINSTAGLKAHKNALSYTISKHALLGFSRMLRHELKTKGIKVTDVFPGAVDTPSWKDDPHKPTSMIAPEDIADAVYGAATTAPNTVIEEILIRPNW